MGLGDGSVALDGLPVWCDEKFCEVPLDGICQETAGTALEVFENRVCLLAIDIRLLHDWETYAVVQLAETADFIVATRVLVSKLVAWKTDDHKATFLVFLIQLFETSKLGSEATFAGCVNYQKGLPLELREVHFFTLDSDGFEIVDTCHFRLN